MGRSIYRKVSSFFDRHPVLFVLIYLTLMLAGGAVLIGIEQAGMSAVRGVRP